MLEVSGLVKAFGNLRAVDGLDLAIAAGTITGLIGPNGAGKTTLFNSIAGALAPEAGAIRFLGERIDRLTSERIFVTLIGPNGAGKSRVRIRTAAPAFASRDSASASCATPTTARRRSRSGTPRASALRPS